MLCKLRNRRGAGAALAHRFVVIGFATSIAIAAGFASHAQAATTPVTYTVTGHDDPAQARCVGTVCNSLRAAVWAVEGTNPGATIQLGSGTYELGTSTWDRSLDIMSDMNLVGAGESSTVIKQDADADEVITVGAFDARVDISNLTVTSGHHIGGTAQLDSSSAAAGKGGPSTGGIQTNGNLTLDQVAVTGNTATGGLGGDSSATQAGGAGGDATAGIEVVGALTLKNSSVSDNTAVGGNGGDASGSGAGGAGGGATAGIAVWSTNSGAVTIMNSVISNNVGTGGTGGASHDPGGQDGLGGFAYGGFAAFDPMAADSVSGSSIRNNSATGGDGGSGSWGAVGGRGGEAEGGGVYETGQRLLVDESTITGNTAAGGHGGSDLSQGGTGGQTLGGGIAVVTSGGLVMHRSTVAMNSATSGAAGVGRSASIVPSAGADAVGGGIVTTGTNAIVNSTIAHNIATGSTGSPAAGSAGFGKPGRGLGGGLLIQAPGSLALASDTVIANTATSAASSSSSAPSSTAGNPAWGGNFDDVSANVSMTDTILSAGQGSSTTGNCALSGTGYIDGGHNLESTQPSQCGLTKSTDEVGADPQLTALASFGGFSPVAALRPLSPARAAGGTCTDQTTTGNPPLMVDERGRPRTGVCDIGAFQTEAATLSQPPQVVRSVDGTVETANADASVGGVLTCSSALGNGVDGTVTESLVWFRDGVSIPGATGVTYVIASVDAGSSLSCSVRVSNAYGVDTATSAPILVPSAIATQATMAKAAVARAHASSWVPW